MLRLLLTNRRQDIVKSTHITDITELGKHTDSMQKFLFGESKAKELNFVGELAEKVSKAIQPQSKKNQFKEKSSRGNSSSNTHGQNDTLTNPIRLLEIKAVKALIGRGLTITTGLFGGPPPKGSLTRKLQTETTCRGNKGKPSSST